MSLNKLSARQINMFDELTHDRAAIEHTLKIAINYTINRKNELGKNRKKFWQELIEQYSLDPEKEYVIRVVEGITCIVEKTEEDGVIK